METGYLRATKEGIPKEKAAGEGNRTGLDCAVLLGMIHGVHEPSGNRLTEGGVDEEQGGKNFSLATSILDDRYLATMRMYVRSFEGVYGLNGKMGDGVWTDGWLVGRYAEDRYDGVARSGGNPW